MRCLVDLSTISVFERVGAYNILLILQKRIQSSLESAPAHIAKVHGLVGPALQACLEGRNVRTPYYHVFDVNQSFFDRAEWTVLGPTELELQLKLSRFRKLSAFLDVKQGFITGADDILFAPRVSYQKMSSRSM